MLIPPYSLLDLCKDIAQGIVPKFEEAQDLLFQQILGGVHNLEDKKAMTAFPSCSLRPAERTHDGRKNRQSHFKV